MKVWVVLEKFPDYQQGLHVYDSRVKAERAVDAIVADYARNEKTVKPEPDVKDYWTDGSGEVSIEIFEEDVE